MLGDAKIEILNYDETYLHTKVPDANYFSYGVKITAANGRTAFLAGEDVYKRQMQGGGWFKDGNDWYWITPSGAAAKGWAVAYGSWYYICLLSTSRCV